MVQMGSSFELLRKERKVEVHQPGIRQGAQERSREKKCRRPENPDTIIGTRAMKSRGSFLSSRRGSTSLEGNKARGL